MQFKQFQYLGGLAILKGDQELQSVWKTLRQCERVGVDAVGFQYSAIFQSQIKFDFTFLIHIHVYEPSLEFTNVSTFIIYMCSIFTGQLFCYVGCMLHMNLRMAQLVKGLSINCISVFRVPNQSVAVRVRILSERPGFSVSHTHDRPNISFLRCM